MIMHLGLPHWQYAFTQVGLDPQSLQWFRFLSPERLAIDIENRKNQENLAKKKLNKN
jgi:tubulin polyglutamylase complex subunit 2